MVHLELEHKKALALAVKYFGIFWGTWTIHIVGNVVIIGVCAILGVILLYLCKLKLYYYNNCVSLRDDNEHRGLHDPILCPDGDESLYLWVLSLPALFASITMLLLTKLILLVGDMESWSSPERKIYATMLRAGLFYFTNIGVFYTFWLKAKPQLDAEGFVAEGIFGKELYRLVVIQGLTEVILNLGLKGVYHLIRRRSPSYKMTEFRTEYCCLSMFFNFSVSRIGVLFCPPLSAFVVLRLIVDFYQNRFILFNMSSREGYSAHVSQVYAPFLLTFFILCYLITTFMNVYYLTDTIPSNYDGPFQQYNESYGEVLTNLLSSKKRTEWIAGLVHPGFLMTFLAILAGLAYFCREWALTYEPIIIQLNELIFLERGDRDLLLKAIFEIGKVTGDDILVGEGDNTRAEHKMRRAAAKREADLVPSSEAETDFEEEYEEEEEADKHIAELIHHVQRRKSVGFAVEGGRASRVHRDKVGHHRRSTKKVQAEHAEHVESIVAKIVDARRRRSLQLPPAEMGRHTSLIPEDSPAFQKYIKDYGKNHPPTTEQHPHQSEPSTQRKSQYLHVPSSSGHQHQQQPGQSKPQHIPVPLSEVRKSTIHPSPSLPAAITPAKKEAPHPRAPKKSPKQLLIQDLNALLSKTTHHQPGAPGHKKK